MEDEDLDAKHPRRGTNSQRRESSPQMASGPAQTSLREKKGQEGETFFFPDEGSLIGKGRTAS